MVALKNNKGVNSTVSKKSKSKRFVQQGKDAVQPENERNNERSMAQAECERKGDQ